MPNLMLTYRAAAFWQRAYCPEISMGFLTKEEVEDIQDVEYEEIPDKGTKNKLAEIALKNAGVKEQPKQEQPVNQSQNNTNDKPVQKTLL